MVEVFKSPFVAPVSGFGAHDDPGGRRPHREATAAPRRPEPRKGVEDVAFIMGVPAAELTPKVTEALRFILGEYDRVRYELDVGRDREVRLQSLADAHPVLPVLNRRALVRELNQILDRAARAETDNAFLCMSLINGAIIRHRHGLAAANAALADVGRVLAAELRASDVLGSLGGYDFGIILTLADGAAAARKAEQLAVAIRDRPPVWADAPLEAVVAWGLSRLAPEVTAEAVIDAADGSLRAGRADGFGRWLAKPS